MRDHCKITDQSRQDHLQPLISRRSLLTGGSSLAIASLLNGCSGQPATQLDLLLLRGSIPPQFVGEFPKTIGDQNRNLVRVEVDTQSQLQTLFTQLQSWKRSLPSQTPPSFWEWLIRRLPFNNAPVLVPDLQTLGDFWLETAIKQGLLLPLNADSLQGWAAIAQLPHFKQLVTRNHYGQPDASGDVWALPYRVGTTVLAYRRDIFAQRNLQPPTDWSDLWRSDLSRRISLLDNPREVIGLTLKRLNQSYNAIDLSSIPTLKAELQTLNQQTRYYSSTSYLQPLLLDDVWLAVAWSTDVLPLTERGQQISIIVPRSGTALFADLWVRPFLNSASLPMVARQWIDFCWQKEYATQLSLATGAVAPSLIGTAINQLPQRFQDQPALLPDLETFKRSEFLLPLPKETLQTYEALWREMRQGSDPLHSTGLTSPEA